MASGFPKEDVLSVIEGGVWSTDRTLIYEALNQMKYEREKIADEKEKSRYFKHITSRDYEPPAVNSVRKDAKKGGR